MNFFIELHNGILALIHHAANNLTVIGQNMICTPFSNGFGNVYRAVRRIDRLVEVA